MDKLFEQQATLILFLGFFVPGFLMIRVYDLLVATERRDFSKSVFDAVAYSAVNFVALSPLLYWTGAAARPPFLRGLAMLVIFVLAPIGWPILLLSVRRTRWFVKRFSHPILRPWDYYFSKGEPCWVIVHLKDQKVGGYYGTGSFASSDPAEPQLYLEQIWALDDSCRFAHKIEQSKGMIFFAKDIIALEFFSPHKENTETCQTTAAGQ
ncbi:MAG: DUF6338 family protein [Chloroflexi bacterium]|nr:DUF6338 family protein [Chloroflexota bacterium]